jgi:pimeloyl-ACP methyl ester carboxylesterase
MASTTAATGLRSLGSLHRAASCRRLEAALPSDRYDSAAALAAFGAPVVVAVTEHDCIVPARFGLALHESLKGPKHLMLMKAADHDDWADRVDASWWQEAILRGLGERR